MDGKPIKPTGKYGYLLEGLREAADAEGVVLMVSNGQHGSGMSIEGTPDFLKKLPMMLRLMADYVERKDKAAQGLPSAH